MIEVANGNLLEADVEALVNAVNCVGVMGKGIALQFKQALPENYRSYSKGCREGTVRLREVFVYDGGSTVNPRWIINFPTKGHWRAKSRIEDIESGIASLDATIRELGIKSIAIPALGCGNGGLDWGLAESAIRTGLQNLDGVRILLFGPACSPTANKVPVRATKPKMTPT